VTMDDKAMQLAAGATVRNQQKPDHRAMSIPRGGAWADYVLDRDGRVLRAWAADTRMSSARPRPGGR